MDRSRDIETEEGGSTHHLRLMGLPPGRKIGPDEARVWLAEEHGAYLDLLGYAYHTVAEPKHRDAMHGLAQDVQTMTAACMEALGTGQTQWIEPEYRRGDRDYPDALADLAAVVLVGLNAEEEGGSLFRPALERLALNLHCELREGRAQA